MRTLADDISADLTRTHLDTGHFAELVSYTPKGGSARSIVAVKDHRQSAQEGQPLDTENEHIYVFLRRHATLGVTSPKRDDELLPAGETVPYRFTGRIVESDNAGWILDFARIKTTAAGGPTVRRLTK